ncbi:MAG: histidine phosphatase family protein [Helicobacteraceae bacterium]|jgi:phosphohistidine phosphatase|nr:histidine phosphatase family protein [Helicobacteraceae bacterium]
MKTLVLMRHAKAEKGKNDRERALTNEGREEAIAIAEKLAENGCKPDIVLVSDARRARETALIVADILGALDRVKTEESLYEGESREYIRAIDSIALRCESALIIGHNPAISDAAAILCEYFTDIFSTAAALGMEFDVAVKMGTGKQLFFLSAK